MNKTRQVAFQPFIIYSLDYFSTEVVEGQEDDVNSQLVRSLTNTKGTGMTSYHGGKKVTT